MAEDNSNRPGGIAYMAVYHDVEEFSYGPGCGLPGKARVFYCIRHKLLRDGLGEKQIGRKFIKEKTGLTENQVETALKFLEEQGIILVHRHSIGKVHFENEYQLNPKKFPELFNWYKNNPTFRVYEGSKSYPQNEGLPPKSGGGVPSYSRGGVPPKSTPGRGLKLSELLKKARSNNPSYKNPSLKNPSKQSENGESFTLSGKTEAEAVKEGRAKYLRQKREMGLT